MTLSELELRQAALTELDALLALADSGPLELDACMRVATLAPLVPGRMRRIVETLARQRDAAAIEALLQLPGGTAGVVEGVFAAMRHGVARRSVDGHAFPRMLALEFRSSTARRFPRLLERASAAFGPALERIRVDGKLHYRVALFERPGLRELAAPLELDVERLHADLLRLRGVRVWLNGWCFDDGSPLAPKRRGPLLHAWFEWARATAEHERAQTRSNNAIDST